MDITATKTTFRKYPAYKDSGVEWLGKIPEHWEIGKLGTLLKPVSIKNRPDLPLLSITREEGVIERNVEDDSENHNFIPDDLSGYKMLLKGQFGMNKMKAWQGSYGIAPVTGIVSPAYYVFDFNSSINPRFFHLAIRSKNYVAFFGQASDGVRVGQWDLSKTRMKEIPFFIPPPEEQTAIATFLDEKIAKIDLAITQKEKMISLLKERKQIIIQDLVTGKKVWNAAKNAWTEPVEVRDSGVEWIGEIPEGWEVKRLKFVAKIRYGLGQPPKELKDGLPIIRATNVERGIIVEKGLLFVDPNAIPWDRNPLLKENDIIVVRSGAYTGDSARIPKKWEGAVAGYDMVMSPFRISSKFLSFAMLSNYVLHGQLYLLRMRAAQPHLNAEELGETIIICPTDNDELVIIEYIEAQSAKIDKAIALQERQIEKLKELKATLIDSAVTGKIKVNVQ